MVSKKFFNESYPYIILHLFLHSTSEENLKGVGPQPLEHPPVRCVHCTKVLGFPHNLLPLLEGLDVCVLSQELFPVIVEQSLLGTHMLFQAEVPFPAVVEPEAKNLPPPGVNSRVAIFSRIQFNISFPHQA
jgi:hypothetical protein